ncbi:MAG: HAD family hydrolase [Eubacteriales bacterium]|nr:HAD family hydrolase [Eubacteriales bacterium]
MKVILFDLDGTLLPMDQNVFTSTYFKLLTARMAPHGFDPKALIDSIWAGTAAMMKNDGHQSNEDAFWEKFTELNGPDSIRAKPYLEEFYANEFNQAKDFCGYNPLAAETVRMAKAAGKTVVLATNPIFPACATINRIRWTGLSPEDFLFYTSYEDCSYCKPHPQYFADVLDRIGCSPEDCLMVGNDAVEDTAAEKLGIKVFLVTDCLLHHEGLDLSRFPQGGFRELQEYLLKN